MIKYIKKRIAEARERKQVFIDLKIAHKELRESVYDFRGSVKQMKVLRDKVVSGHIGGYYE